MWHAPLPPPPSALEGCPADGLSSTGRPCSLSVLSALHHHLRWSPIAFFCTQTDWSWAVCYHGDHFLENTGKEEGCQWCKVQEQGETAGERSSSPSDFHTNSLTVKVPLRDLLSVSDVVSRMNRAAIIVHQYSTTNHRHPLLSHTLTRTMWVSMSDHRPVASSYLFIVLVSESGSRKRGIRLHFITYTILKKL